MKKIFAITMIFLSTLSMFAEEFAVENAKAKVAILYHDTDLKKQLLSKLTEDLNSRQISVITDNIVNGEKHPAELYDAVVLLSRIEKFGPHETATDYIKKNKYSNKIIYLSTYLKFNNPYGLMNLSLDKDRIDAITTASPGKGEKINTEEILKAHAEIMRRIMELISGR
ncbi:MAG: hypothetical protein JXK07_07920 [Spirochaetes bacterium]|nr:hypothetical protein [Spirochaetota bacterium]MBN2770036.1 hypothetical protein [Spirochaetota bacterium]